ncbi:hypothetical protein J3R82DRAFT_9668 [Butyriboletus roseoflavus]|nr:hypothetical protein J3R82DRAFT_9668 [Butyriboletus roseoflavus]
MRTSSITKSATRPEVRALKPRVKRSFARMPARSIWARACHVKLPRKRWDRIVLLMFICCLFIFLHAFLGFGLVNEDLRTLNDTFVHPLTPLSISPPWNRRSVPSSEEQKIRAPGVTRVMLDWHGNYELLPSTASIPQDAFPDPTPALVRAEQGGGLDEGSPSMTTKIKTPVDIPPTLYGTPYDPFRLAFEDSIDGGEYHGLYPVTGPPRTARTRRFGRCLPAEVCL